MIRWLHRYLMRIYYQVLVTLLVVIVCTILFNLLCTILFRPLNHVSQALAQIANGSAVDLTQRIHVDNQDEVGELAQNFGIPLL
ncbi:HAMP domain-containing protein [Vibrio lentus]|nr:HAMP domain-containing protein [Vibrio lentus]